MTSGILSPSLCTIRGGGNGSAGFIYSGGELGSVPVSRTGGQFLMSTVAVASLERSSLQMTAVVITQAE